MCKTIKQKIHFKASPRVVYELLASSARHSSFTGKKALISRKIGGSFSVYGGYATGVNVDLVPGKRIVQAWRAADFPEGIYSMAAFVLTPLSHGGTELVLTHRGVPKDLIPDIEQGWREFYWDKMREYLKKHSRA